MSATMITTQRYGQEQLMGLAKDSAKYLLNIFESDSANIPMIISDLTSLCNENKELVIFILIRKYCRLMNHDLPEHYESIATDGDAFDFYCRQILHFMVEFAR